MNVADQALLSVSGDSRGPGSGLWQGSLATGDAPDRCPVQRQGAHTNSVALVTPAYPARLARNGIASFTERMIPGLEAAGCSVTILARRAESNGAHGSRSVVRLADFRPGRPRRVLHRLLAACSTRHMDDRNAVYSLRSAIAFARRSRGIELVQMEETFGWAARLVGQIDVPMVVRVAGPTLLHGVVRNNRGASSMQRSDLELQGIRDAAGVVFQSHAFKARVCAALGGSLRKCTVIPNPAPNYSQAETWTRHTAEFGRVLFVGRFDRHKGGDLVIDAWSRVAASTPCSRLVIIGPDRGFHNEQGRGWSIGEYIADHVPAALQDRIEYLGSQPPAVIEVERRRASLVVMASRIENFSNTLLEAMAMGCPVIASDSGGTPEIVGRDGAGVLFQSGNSTAFADAMEQCLADPDRAAAMGTEARRRCVERFSLPKVAEMYAAFYREVLGTRE